MGLALASTSRRAPSATPRSGRTGRSLATSTCSRTAPRRRRRASPSTATGASTHSDSIPTARLAPADTGLVETSGSRCVSTRPARRRPHSGGRWKVGEASTPSTVGRRSRRPRTGTDGVSPSNSSSSGSRAPTLTLPNEGRVRTCRVLVQTLPPHGNSRQANEQKPASQKHSDRELGSATRLRQLPGGGGWRRRRRGRRGRRFVRPPPRPPGGPPSVFEEGLYPRPAPLTEDTRERPHRPSYPPALFRPM